MGVPAGLCLPDCGICDGISGFFAVFRYEDMLEDPADSDGEYLDDIQWEMIRLFIGCTVIVLGLVLLISDMGTWSREDRKAAQALQRVNDRQKTLEAINRQTQKWYITSGWRPSEP